MINSDLPMGQQRAAEEGVSRTAEGSAWPGRWSSSMVILKHTCTPLAGHAQARTPHPHTDVYCHFDMQKLPYLQTDYLQEKLHLLDCHHRLCRISSSHKRELIQL